MSAVPTPSISLLTILPSLLPAMGQHFRERGLDILHQKGDMGEPGFVDLLFRAGTAVVVLEYLQGGAAVAVARKAEVGAPHMGPGHAGPLLDPLA